MSEEIKEFAEEIKNMMIETSGIPKEMIESPDIMDCAKNLNTANNLAVEYYNKLREKMNDRLYINYNSVMEEALKQTVQ